MVRSDGLQLLTPAEMHNSTGSGAVKKALSSGTGVASDNQTEQAQPRCRRTLWTPQKSKRGSRNPQRICTLQHRTRLGSFQASWRNSAVKLAGCTGKTVDESNSTPFRRGNTHRRNHSSANPPCHFGQFDSRKIVLRRPPSHKSGSQPARSKFLAGRMNYRPIVTLFRETDLRNIGKAKTAAA
eukprot:CAMPEP_0204364912 /NCGR_PEP_ID=MMETSP0469-20131031/41513_1 /ASSEMBLY_ACC=CAM_ASM_000384 /TAXON_ID=2969 /ORGANISM="Oxyrrhis marina" /LENGTH=182 /DNA_ID=CAMNT_0051353909 /DNA_START=283 /DNA_END=829 /DNA_ORIENTATION=-